MKPDKKQIKFCSDLAKAIQRCLTQGVAEGHLQEIQDGASKISVNNPIRVEFNRLQNKQKTKQ